MPFNLQNFFNETSAKLQHKVYTHVCHIFISIGMTIAVMVLPYECDRKQIAILDGYKYCYQAHVQGGGVPGPPPIEKKAFRFCPPPPLRIPGHAPG